MEYILIFISAIFVNNIILSQFLGICPFLGVSKKIDTSLGMSVAVAFVLTLATIVTWCVQTFVLEPNGLQYLQTIAFILVIASLFDGIGIGLGFTLGLTTLGICRELLGSGSIFGFTLLPETYNILLFVLPPGAFITLGFLIAIVNKLRCQS